VTYIQIETQYSTGAARQAIERALAAAGKDLGHLRPEDLALLEDFHTMGRIATTQLADLAGITPDDEVLDAGCGIGGTARYLAARSRCHVVAVDLTKEYCETARWLNQLAGLDDRICVRQADVRDIVAGEDREPDFPVPWADRPEYSHLTTSDRLRTAIETSGFEIEQWNDLTDQAAAMMQTLLALPPSPIGLQAFVPDFEPKANNLTAALADGRLRAIQGIVRAV